MLARLVSVMQVVHKALQDTYKRELEEEPCIMGPIPSHGPHSALLRGEELQKKSQQQCCEELKTYFNAP